MTIRSGLNDPMAPTGAVFNFPPRVPSAPSRMEHLLMATLAFEAVVDAVIHLHVRTGLLASDQVTAEQRANYRAAAQQLLNELDAQHRMRAEHACTEVMLDVLPTVQRPRFRLDVHDALTVYREHLRNAPVFGVGQIR